MSNFKKKTQLPPEETVKKRGGVPLARGYISSAANGMLTVYTTTGAAPDPASLPDGTPVLVEDGSDLNMFVAVSGAYKQVVI